MTDAVEGQDARGVAEEVSCVSAAIMVVRPVPVRRQRPLSRREAEVLDLVGRGSSNKDISYELGLAWSTVRVLLHQAALKLGCAGRRELEAWARIRAELAAGEVTR